MILQQKISRTKSSVYIMKLFEFALCENLAIKFCLFFSDLLHTLLQMRFRHLVMTALKRLTPPVNVNIRKMTKKYFIFNI